MLPKIGALLSVSGNYVLGDISDKIKMIPNMKLSRIDENEAIFEDMANNESKTLTFDALVISLGVRKNDALLSEMQSVCEKVEVVGDAIKTGNIGTSIKTAFMSAFSHQVNYDEML